MYGPNERKGLVADLGAILERLWTFHQAMRYGQPVANADESLAQLETALKQSTHFVQRSSSATTGSAADARDAQAF
jgi:hypothetical protein